ncbi:hypothetical protein Tco_0019266 [Tanacetum coccineum]
MHCSFLYIVSSVMIDHYVALPSLCHYRGVAYWIYVRNVPLLLVFACSQFGALVMSVIEIYDLNTECGRGRGPKGGNDERVDELNGQGNEQGKGANRNIERVNGGVGGAPDFSTIITQQLQNLLPAILAQFGNQGNVGNQNGNVVNENVQENVRNVLVNGNWVGCSYKEFLACNPKEYNGKGGAVVLTQWIKKMESVQDMSGCKSDAQAGMIAVSMSWNDFKFMMIDGVLSQIPLVARLVPHLVSTHKVERLRIRVMTWLTDCRIWWVGATGQGLRFLVLSDEAVRSGSIKKLEIDTKNSKGKCGGT